MRELQTLRFRQEAMPRPTEQVKAAQQQDAAAANTEASEDANEASGAEPPTPQPEPKIGSVFSTPEINTKVA